VDDRSRIRFAHNADVDIAYEALGDLEHGEPLLLIMGLDFQMVWWPDGLIDRLVDAGFAVVRFDNRDTGLSTHFAPEAAPSPYKALMGRVPPAYTGRDMLDDALAVMDAVGWDSAHVMGASMGSALAQGLAMENPERVRSLICCSGAPADAGPLRTLRYLRPGVLLRMSRLGAGRTPEERVDILVEVYRAISSPAYSCPEEWARRAAQISDSRAPRDPSTTQRQLAAGRAHPSKALETITAPTLVISGRDDALVRWTAGRDTADRISRATFVCYDGMGHDLPEELLDEVVDQVRMITAHS
jgi:pimeloyl-ACP methyl ester carboxylesterase